MVLTDTQLLVPIYILLGAIVAMIYSLRRIILLEKKILSLEAVILNLDKKISQNVARKRK